MKNKITYLFIPILFCATVFSPVKGLNSVSASSIKDGFNAVSNFANVNYGYEVEGDYLKPNNIQSVNLPVSENEILETSSAAFTTYKVVSGDSMWKIAVKFQVGVSELIKANPSLKNPDLIYVGQVINIPNAAPLSSLEDEVIRLLNIERVNNGLQVLTKNWEASRVARYKSQDMIDKNYFAHISPTYGSPFTMMENFGLRFSAAAENIAYGQRTAQEVMTAWMNSPGHRANILNRSFTHIGVGAAKAYNGTLYWTQMFLKPIG